MNIKITPWGHSIKLRPDQIKELENLEELREKVVKKWCEEIDFVIRSSFNVRRT